MKKAKAGFVLPMIVVTGLVLTIVMAFTLQTIAISRENLINQRAQLLARQAAESGLARAQQCIRSNENVVTWSDSTPLRPNTNCYGRVINTSSIAKYFMVTDTYRSTYQVKPADINDGFRNASSVGKVEILRKKNTYSYGTVREYGHTASAHIILDLTFDDIAFGSIYGYGTDTYLSSTSRKIESVYFFTKTLGGVINGVGGNTDDVIRGYHAVIGSPSYPSGIQVKIPDNAKVNKIFTDFQGNGWNAYLLTSDNNVYVTGVNGNALMGNGIPYDNVPSDLPLWDRGQTKMKIPPGEQVDRIFTNGSVAFILMKSKRLFATGRGWGWGLLGCGLKCPPRATGPTGAIDMFANSPIPVAVECSGGRCDYYRKFKTVSTDSIYEASDTVACGIDYLDRVYCWGNNEKKQITHYGSKYYDYGVRIGTFGDGGFVKAKDIKTDGYTVYVLTEDGDVYTRGYNRYGQAGRGECYYSDDKICDSLGAINFGPGVKIEKMAVDAYSALFLTTEGRVYGVGLNDMGQLGNGYSGRGNHTYRPTLYNLPYGVKASDVFIVSPGVYSEAPYYGEKFKFEARFYRNSLVLTTTGEVYGAGSNYYGQLGVGKIGENMNSDQSLHQRCPENEGTPEIEAARSAVGQGVGYSSAVSIPVKMCLKYKNYSGSYTPVFAKRVRSGLGTSIVITDKNKVFTVGHNHQGQLGSQNVRDYYIPEAHKLTNQWNVMYY